MIKIFYSIFFLAFISISINYGQVTPVERGLRAISPDVIKAQLGFLASDWTEGRAAGEKGEYLAADYIASMLQLYGVRPAGDLKSDRGGSYNKINDERSFFQNFVLLKTIPGDEQVFKLKTSDAKMYQTTTFTYNVDFTVRPSDPGIEIEAPVVFAGYGLISDKLNYNNLSKINVKGKFILKISGIQMCIRDRIIPE